MRGGGEEGVGCGEGGEGKRLGDVVRTGEEYRMMGEGRGTRRWGVSLG